jgi:hypothetical protein
MVEFASSISERGVRFNLEQPQISARSVGGSLTVDGNFVLVPVTVSSLCAAF